MTIVDLTDDTMEPDPPTAARAPNNQAWPQLPGMPGVEGYGAIPPLRPPAPYSLDRAANFSSYPEQGAAAPAPARPPWISIRFSLINTKEFTAKASTTVSKEVC